MGCQNNLTVAWDYRFTASWRDRRADIDYAMASLQTADEISTQTAANFSFGYSAGPYPSIFYPASLDVMDRDARLQRGE